MPSQSAKPAVQVAIWHAPLVHAVVATFAVSAQLPPHDVPQIIAPVPQAVELET